MGWGEPGKLSGKNFPLSSPVDAVYRKHGHFLVVAQFEIHRDCVSPARTDTGDMAKRPRDPNQLAKLIVDIATGEAEDTASEAKRHPESISRPTRQCANTGSNPVAGTTD